MLRLLAAVTSWLVLTAVLAPVCFFTAIFLAGPHADVLPDVLGGPVVIVCAVVLLVVPAWAAVTVWRRIK